MSNDLPCDVDEIRTLFLFEKLSEEQLDRLCRVGHVEAVEPGWVLREGEPALWFYVLLEGSVTLFRRVGGDDVEINRTDVRGVYAGAFQAYLGDRIRQVYNNSLRANVRVEVLRARGRRLRPADAGMVPDGTPPPRGSVLRYSEHAAGTPTARAPSCARFPLGRSYARVEQSRGGGGSGHLVAAGAARRHAPRIVNASRPDLIGARWHRSCRCRGKPSTA